MMIAVTSFSQLNAQTLEWLNVFDTHSLGAGPGLHPNSLIDDNGKITTTIIENDTLKLYQTLEDGTITGSYITEKIINENHTPLIRTAENELTLVYQANPYPGSYWLLHTDSDLNVIEDEMLEFPPGMSFIQIQNLIAYDEELYLTFLSYPLHYLCKINSDKTLSVIYSGSCEQGFGEDYILLDNGNIIFSYKYGNGHIIRCFSIENETLVWEQSIDRNHGILLDYKMFKAGNILYTAGLERDWVDGVADDELGISHIDIDTGNIIFQAPVELTYCSGCFIGFENFVYNTINEKIYISYSSGFPQPAVSLVELNTISENILNQVYFPIELETEFFQLNKRSVVHIKPDGSLVILYKSYKNATEQMNLYITPLNSQLESLGTFEFHIQELESIEHPSEVLNYDNSRILITGIVPNKNPSISLEQVEYFTVMINTDEILSVDNRANTDFRIKVFPNPANEKINISIPENISELTVYDSLGKIIHKEEINQKEFTLDIASYQKGIYLLAFSGNHKTVKKLIVK